MTDGPPPQVTPSMYTYPPGLERVVSGVPATTCLPELLDRFGYRRALIYSSRTLNRSTPVVTSIADALGDRVVGVSDEVGEHAPIGNIVKAVQRVQETGADVLLCIGGGSSSDFGKFVQLGVTVGARSREELLMWQRRRGESMLENLMPPESHGPMRIRQICVPTTFSTSELTHAGTPVDDVTGAKVQFAVREGSPRAVVYDPELLRWTPRSLLASTGVRGLDHAANNILATRPDPFSVEISARAVALFTRYLPQLVADPTDIVAGARCQVASWMAAMGNLGGKHGFSHSSVHVLAPWAGVSHGDAACVMFLAQARWFGQVSEDAALLRVSAEMGQPGRPLADVALDFLRALGRPTSLAELGVDASRIPELVELMLQHPNVTNNNRLPITSAEQVIAVLQAVAV